MKSNEDIVVTSILEQEGENYGQGLTNDQVFARWSFEQVLKDYDPSYDDLQFGDVDHGDDGGIDGLFVYLDGAIVRERPDHAEIRRGVGLDLFLIQSKNQAAFKEGVFDKLSMGLDRLLRLDLLERDLRDTFSTGVLERRELFRESYLALAPKHPQLRVWLVYASRGDTNDIHPKVIAKADVVVDQIRARFAGAEVARLFLGAKELVAKAATNPTYTLELPFFEYLTGPTGSAHIVLSKLEDYIKFVTTEQGTLRRHLFDSNVRDYQGQVEVNKEISQTLDTGDKDLDFWWLNNGVTILASKATVNNRRMMLDDVQIVNGLQTTETIFKHWSSSKPLKVHSVLVKIVITQDEAFRDRIIKSTNFQTAIPQASLRATDHVQRNIEAFLKSHDIYYDRRKNYYKNQGKPAGKIVSIPLLAQAFAACVLQEPHVARGRPGSLIKSDAAYARIFNDKSDLRLYLSTIQILRRVTAALESFPTADRTNFTLHAATLATMLVCNQIKVRRETLAEANVEKLDGIQLRSQIDWLLALAHSFEKQHQVTLNTVSKSSDFAERLLNEVSL